QTEHEIHALHRLAARAFGDVVDRAHHDDAIRALVDLPGDVDEVCPDNVLRVGQPRVSEQAHERFFAVGAVKNDGGIERDHAGGDVGVNRCRDSTIDRHEVR